MEYVFDVSVCISNERQKKEPCAKGVFCLVHVYVPWSSKAARTLAAVVHWQGLPRHDAVCVYGCWVGGGSRVSAATAEDSGGEMGRTLVAGQRRSGHWVCAPGDNAAEEALPCRVSGGVGEGRGGEVGVHVCVCV